MTRDSHDGADTSAANQWEDRIEAFENAYAREGKADFERFLPDERHPLYVDLLAELIRIDLEYSWKQSPGKRIEEYRLMFPRLFEEPDALQAVAYEEYRLRRQAGEEPTPAEYQERIGMPIGLWPRPQRRAADRPDSPTPR
jgi:hypothetical protein